MHFSERVRFQEILRSIDCGIFCSLVCLLLLLTWHVKAVSMSAHVIPFSRMNFTWACENGPMCVCAHAMRWKHNFPLHRNESESISCYSRFSIEWWSWQMRRKRPPIQSDKWNVVHHLTVCLSVCVCDDDERLAWPRRNGSVVNWGNFSLSASRPIWPKYLAPNRFDMRLIGLTLFGMRYIPDRIGMPAD